MFIRNIHTEKVTKNIVPQPERAEIHEYGKFAEKFAIQVAVCRTVYAKQFIQISGYLS